MKPYLLLLSLLPAAVVAGEAGHVHEFSLDNGLKVLVKEDHRAPVVLILAFHIGAYLLLDRLIGETLGPRARVVLARSSVSWAVTRLCEVRSRFLSSAAAMSSTSR